MQFLLDAFTHVYLINYKIHITKSTNHWVNVSKIDLRHPLHSHTHLLNPPEGHNGCRMHHRPSTSERYPINILLCALVKRGYLPMKFVQVVQFG
jgi:hypothetical protein